MPDSCITPTEMPNTEADARRRHSVRLTVVARGSKISCSAKSDETTAMNPQSKTRLTSHTGVAAVRIASIPIYSMLAISSPIANPPASQTPFPNGRVILYSATSESTIATNRAKRTVGTS